MKLNSSTRVLESTLNTPVKQFKIAASAKAFQILSSSIYTKKEEAIVRELLANAADAHVAAGRADRAIRLHLPTELEPHLEIVDFGTGLSDEAIHELYTTYFGSDKTHTNDLIGGLGLGSKSPLCYTDQFGVTSSHGGKVTFWSIFVDASGTPCVTKTDEDEYNGLPGLSVSIPIAADDIGAFVRAASNLVPYFQVPIECNIPLPINRHVMATFDTPDGKIVMTKGAPYPQAVVQGSVPYRLDMEWAWENLGYSDRMASIPYILRNWQFEIHVPIGTFEIATSRESLAYDKTTKTKLSAMFDAMANHIVNDFLSQVQGAETYADAIGMYLTMSGNVIQMSKTLSRKHKGIVNGSLLAWLDDPKWNGKTLKHVEKPAGFSINTLDTTWRNRQMVRRKVLASSTDEWMPNNAFHNEILSDTRPVYYQPKQAPFRNYFENNLREIPALLMVGDEKIIRKWLDDTFGKGKVDMKPVPKVAPKAKAANTNRNLGGTNYEAELYCLNPVYQQNKMLVTADMLVDVLENGGRVLMDQTGVYETQLQNMWSLGKQGFIEPGTVDFVVRVKTYPSHTRVNRALTKLGAVDSMDALWEGVRYNAKHIRYLQTAASYTLNDLMADINVRNDGSRTGWSRVRQTVVDNSSLKNTPNDKPSLVWWIPAFLEWLSKESDAARDRLGQLPQFVLDDVCTSLPADRHLVQSVINWRRSIPKARAILLELGLNFGTLAELLGDNHWYSGARNDVTALLIKTLTYTTTEV